MIRRKQNVNTGNRNNLNFIQLPFNTLIQQTRYKAEAKSINVIIQEEGHTIRCSFPENETIEHHDRYIENRTKGGVFQSSKGILIHADLNVAYNIIKKQFQKLLRTG
ncbi:MAG: transposase [Candidatus Thermoplasmatota archaeon]|jgi:putative transposase|nr:transposase [Candidatus Thermoplasmatota archaeon]MCL5964026.1 transposase [Candidatus Thermoplasmatota archaeon]